MEAASGEVAAPTSPIPPERESGAIIRKGTAVVIVLRIPASESFCKTEIGVCCANVLPPIAHAARDKNNFFIKGFILLGNDKYTFCSLNSLDISAFCHQRSTTSFSNLSASEP